VASRIQKIVVQLMLAGLAEACWAFCRGTSAVSVGVWAERTCDALGLKPTRGRDVKTGS
jgi:hypothetical protein